MVTYRTKYKWQWRYGTIIKNVKRIGKQKMSFSNQIKISNAIVLFWDFCVYNVV